jgi:hypothetical protein
LVIKAYKDYQSAQKPCSFQDGRALLSFPVLEGQVIRTLGQSDDSISPILGESIAFAGTCLIGPGEQI